METKPVFTAHVEGDPNTNTVEEYVEQKHSSESGSRALVIGFVILVLLVGLGTAIVPMVLQRRSSQESPTSEAEKPAQKSKGNENAINQAHDAQRKSDLSLILRAMQLFYAERQRFPASLDELSDARVMELGIEQASGKDMPVDPKTREYYQYIVFEEGQNCIIRAILSSGKPYELSCIQ